MSLRKHSVTIRGHSTSFSIEDEFWVEFQKLAKSSNRPLAELVTEIDSDRPPERNLSSAIRIFVLKEALKAAR